MTMNCCDMLDSPTTLYNSDGLGRSARALERLELKENG